MIIKIGRKKYSCQVETTTTQKGLPVVRIISDEAPTAENGFKLYTDDESVEFDRTDYKFLYREQGNIREYTTEAEEIVSAEGYISGVPADPIQKQFAAVNNRITSITPYKQEKKAYFGEVEKVFYGVPNGIMTVQMDNEFTVQRIEDRVYVRFERLEEAKDITLIVQ